MSLSIWRAVPGFGAYEPTGGLIVVDMTTIWAPPGSTRCSNAASMLIKVASLGNQQALISPSPLHPELTKADLMGELGHLLALPAYQLALPFTQQ